jgi:DNA-binding MarR family transcriptional regulator/DNA-binding transcriptional regulator YhcF (GntR family)
MLTIPAFTGPCDLPDLPTMAQTALWPATQTNPGDPDTAYTLEAMTQAFLSHLHRGGAWAFIWTPNGAGNQDKKRSCWIPVGKALIPPIAWQHGRNLHFGVNPSAQRRANYQASTNDTIAALNCLYAEFDGKDFTDPTVAEIAEYLIALRREKENVRDETLWKEASHRAKEAKFAADIPYYKRLALAHVQKLNPAPSVVVDSGGGYQVYWLLRETFCLQTETDRAQAKAWQKQWVAFVGGDPGAHDLRRVLRLPGSRNYKPRYAPEYPLVTYVTYNLAQQYDRSELVALLPKDLPNRPVHHRQLSTGKPHPAHTPPDGNSVIAAYNDQVPIEEALQTAGYTQQGKRWVRPGGASPSVLIFPETNTSYHHSSSDPLHSDHARTPFDVLVEYEHAGRVRDAVKAVANLLGLKHTRPQEQEALDHRLLLNQVKLWVRTTSFAGFIPADLQGKHYRTDGTDTKVADAVLCLMEHYNRLTVYTTKRALGQAAGVHGDTALRSLTKLQQFLFVVDVSQEKGLTITLQEAFCLAQVRQEKLSTSFVAQVREANEYSARKQADPFLTGTARLVKAQCQEAVAVAGGTFQEWLATIPKGLGEGGLRVLDALGRCGEMTCQELAAETGKTQGAIWRACRRLEQEGLVHSTREHQRAPKIYALAPDVWRQVEQLAPELRTYRLSVERTDRDLKASQLWVTRQQAAARARGDQEQAKVLACRLLRLGTQRMKTLALLYADRNFTETELVKLAFDVQVPIVPHPAVMAKRQRWHEQARMDVAASKRREQWQLAATAQTLRQAGVNKQAAVRMLGLAGYSPREAWSAVHQVWPLRLR